MGLTGGFKLAAVRHQGVVLLQNLRHFLEGRSKLCRRGIENEVDKKWKNMQVLNRNFQSASRGDQEELRAHIQSELNYPERLFSDSKG